MRGLLAFSKPTSRRESTMTETQTATSKFALSVDYTNNARLLCDDARGSYDRWFDDYADAESYAQVVKRHAEAKPYMMVDVTIVELDTYQHVYREIWNAR
jgi:hypothetical protein